jgi:hypothetical protein
MVVFTLRELSLPPVYLASMLFPISSITRPYLGSVRSAPAPVVRASVSWIGITHPTLILAGHSFCDVGRGFQLTFGLLEVA